MEAVVASEVAVASREAMVEVAAEALEVVSADVAAMEVVLASLAVLQLVATVVELQLLPMSRPTLSRTASAPAARAAATSLPVSSRVSRRCLRRHEDNWRGSKLFSRDP